MGRPASRRQKALLPRVQLCKNGQWRGPASTSEQKTPRNRDAVRPGRSAGLVQPRRWGRLGAAAGTVSDLVLGAPRRDRGALRTKTGLGWNAIITLVLDVPDGTGALWRSRACLHVCTNVQTSQKLSETNVSRAASD